MLTKFETKSARVKGIEYLTLRVYSYVRIINFMPFVKVSLSMMTWFYDLLS